MMWTAAEETRRGRSVVLDPDLLLPFARARHEPHRLWTRQERTRTGKDGRHEEGVRTMMMLAWHRGIAPARCERALQGPPPEPHLPQEQSGSHQLTHP